MSGTTGPAFATGGVRAPLLRVLTNGVPIPGAIEAHVTSNNWYQADRFDATFALYADPAYGPGWWGSNAPLIDVQVCFVLPNQPLNWQSLIIGKVDQASVDMEGGTVHVEGRDLTAALIETKTQETFLNKTFSEIVTIIAGRHQMQADVTPTTTPAGRFYQNDHDQMTLGQFHHSTTEWDLLVNLAQREGYDLYVTGTTLHAHPSSTLSPAAPNVFNVAPPPGAVVYPVQWVPSHGGFASCNVMNLRLERSMTIAKDVVVEVRSWHSKKGKAFTKTARARSALKNLKDPPQRYVVVRPNMTEDAAQQLANALLVDITKHERVATFDASGDLTFSPRAMIQITGTASEWDQFYYVDSIERSIDQTGFLMNARVKNHSTGSQATLA